MLEKMPGLLPRIPVEQRQELAVCLHLFVFCAVREPDFALAQPWH